MAISMSVAVITGAGSGVGQALAVELSNRGWNIGLIGHGETALRQTAGQLKTNFSVQVVDVADANAVDNAGAAIKAELGTIDAWVNAAAVAVFGGINEIEADDASRVLAVNIGGVINGSRTAAHHMKEKGGAIINVGSSLAFTSVPNNVLYAATKAAVRSFSQGFGAEVHDDGIIVSAVHLPAVATPWFAKVKTLTPFQSRPVGPIHTATSVGKALANVVEQPRSGDVFMGVSTLSVVIGAQLLPRFVMSVARKLGVRLQTTKRAAPAINNLWTAIDPPPSAPTNLRASSRQPALFPLRLNKRKQH
jgi:short-subunit dehydrogenase